MTLSLYSVFYEWIKAPEATKKPINIFGLVVFNLGQTEHVHKKKKDGEKKYGVKVVLTFKICSSVTVRTQQI